MPTSHAPLDRSAFSLSRCPKIRSRRNDPALTEKLRIEEQAKAEEAGIVAEEETADFGDGDPEDILGETVLPIPTLARDLLPAVIADYAFDVAERIGVDPAMVACPMLAVCAAAIHDDIKIQPKEFDTSWTESTRLNVLTVAPPGSNKTGAINAAVKPLQQIELKWRQEDAKALELWERTEKLRVAAEKHVLRNAAPVGGPNDAMYLPVGTELPTPSEKPSPRRLVMNDTTTEAVCKMLAGNPRGMLLHVDEAMGWIAGFDAYRTGGAGKDQAFWLQADGGGQYSKGPGEL
jgi:hypothetical protein